MRGCRCGRCQQRRALPGASDETHRCHWQLWAQQQARRQTVGAAATVAEVAGQLAAVARSQARLVQERRWAPTPLRCPGHRQRQEERRQPQQQQQQSVQSRLPLAAAARVAVSRRRQGAASGSHTSQAPRSHASPHFPQFEQSLAAAAAAPAAYAPAPAPQPATALRSLLRASGCPEMRACDAGPLAASSCHRFGARASSEPRRSPRAQPVAPRARLRRR